MADLTESQAESGKILALDKKVKTLTKNNKNLNTRIRDASVLLKANTRSVNRALAILENENIQSEIARAARLLSLTGDELLGELLEKTKEKFYSPWSYVLRTYFANNRSQDSAGTLLLNDTRTQNNIGCRTTTNCLVGLIDKSSNALWHTVTLSELNLLAKILKLRVGEAPGPDNFLEHLAMFQDDPSFELYRNTINKASFIVINGEGSFYDAQPKGLILLIMATYASKILNKRVVILNHSADLSDPIMKGWTEQTYPYIHTAVVREHISYNNLIQNGFDKNKVKLGYDAAFLQHNEENQTETSCYKFLRFVRYMLGRGSHDIDDGSYALGPDSIQEAVITKPFVVLTGTSAIYRPDREPYDSEQEFETLCRNVLKNTKHQPVLWAADAADARLLRPIALKMGLPFIPAVISSQGALNILKEATAIISGRWHASILAASVGTPPILGDANFFKTQALHEILELPWDMFDYRNISESEESIIQNILYIMENRKHIRKKMIKMSEAVAMKAKSSLEIALDV